MSECQKEININTNVLQMSKFEDMKASMLNKLKDIILSFLKNPNGNINESIIYIIIIDIFKDY